jgi:hypothetical protein
MKSILRLGLVTLFGCACQCVLAQERPPCDAPMTHENRNQVDPKPIKLPSISGSAKDEQGAPITKVCIGLFSEKDHRLVDSTETAENGRFAFGKVPPGQYRLVAKHQVLCTANVILLVTNRQSRSKKELRLHMNVAGIDKCSYGDLAKTHGSNGASHAYAVPLNGAIH